MGTMVPLRGAIHRAFSIDDVPHSTDVTTSHAAPLAPPSARPPRPYLRALAGPLAGFFRPNPMIGSIA